jgi:hypothetical protein
MNPRRPHAQIHLPPLDAGYALTLVDIFERAITAIWNAHGDSMANLRALRDDHTKSRDLIPSGDPNAPDIDF